MKIFFKGSLLVLLLSISLLVLPQASKIYAQTTTTSLSTQTQNNLHTYTQATMINVLSSVVCLISGIDPVTHNKTCLGIDTKNKTLGVNTNEGVNRVMASSMDVLYHSFPHTSDYIAYLRSNFHGASDTAYAATGPTNGLGYQGLLPMIEIWVALRNVAYLFITLAFMVIGVAIMLRVKIDPRTVMTIENQLPKLIIGLILITFSFAIAGFLIDIMYVLINFIYSIATTIPNTNFKDLSPSVLQNSTPWDAVVALVPAKSLPVSTATINTLGQNINLPIIQSLTNQLTTLAGNMPLIGNLMRPLTEFVINLMFGIGQTAGNVTSSSATVQQGYGMGISDLAAGSAIAFGDVLKKFFEISPSAPQISPVPIANLFSIFGIVGTDFAKGSPVSAILDIGSYILSFSFANNIAGRVSNFDIMGGIFGNEVGINLGPVLGMITFNALFNTFFNVIDSVLRDSAINILVWFVVYIAVFLATAKLLFSLVFAWATILFQVAMAPLSIAFGLIPGAKGFGFSSWLKSIAANLLAFPVTIGILLLGSALVQAFDIAPGQSAQAFFIPPLIGGNQLPVALLMALSVIFAASNGPQIAKDMLEEKDNKNFGAFGETSGSALQAVYKAGKGVTYGFGKTPQPGQRGGPLAAFGAIS